MNSNPQNIENIAKSWKYRNIGSLDTLHFQQYLYIVAVSFIGGGNWVPRENHWPVASHWQTLSHTHVMLYRVHHAWAGFELILGRQWCPLCTRLTHLVGFSASSLKQQSAGRHVTPLLTHYSDSEPTSLCSYSLLLCAYQKNSKYQFYMLLFGLTWPGLEPMMYCTRGEYAINYNNDVVYLIYDILWLFA
jgi:hypothetical protein